MLNLRCIDETDNLLGASFGDVGGTFDVGRITEWLFPPFLKEAHDIIQNLRSCGLCLQEVLHRKAVRFTLGSGPSRDLSAKGAVPNMLVLMMSKFVDAHELE